MESRLRLKGVTPPSGLESGTLDQGLVVQN